MSAVAIALTISRLSSATMSGGRSGRNDEPHEAGALDLGVAALRQGGDFRQGRDARFAGHRERAQFPIPVERNRCSRRAETDRRVAGDHRRHRRGGAGERHYEIDAEGQSKLLAGEVRCGAGAGG
jgi:hypothetical protein